MKKISLILIAVFICLLGVLAAFGYWPIVFVNNHPIFYKEFKPAYEIVYLFYRNDVQAFNQNPALLESPEMKEELKRATVQSLIEKKIIEIELAKEIKPDDLKKRVGEKINNINLTDQTFQKGVEALYKLSVDDFKNMVLIPKAQEEILGTILADKGVNLIDWMNKTQKEAKIFIFLSDLKWADNEVKIAK